MYIRWIALLVAAGLALYVCWLMLMPFVEVLAWAVVLAIIFHPVHRRIAARTGRPGWSAMLSTALVVMVIPASLITMAIAREISGAAQNLQGWVHNLLDPNSPAASRVLRWLAQYVDVEKLNPHDYLRERLGSLGGAIAGRTLGLIGGVAGAVVKFFFIIFTMYY